jgi:hypothetical protein
MRLFVSYPQDVETGEPRGLVAVIKRWFLQSVCLRNPNVKIEMSVAGK